MVDDLATSIDIGPMNDEQISIKIWAWEPHENQTVVVQPLGNLDVPKNWIGWLITHLAPDYINVSKDTPDYQLREIREFIDELPLK